MNAPLDPRRLAWSRHRLLPDAPFESPIKDHYLTNPICRASSVMAELSRLRREREAQTMAAE